MNKRSLVLLTIILFKLSIFAQSDFVPGFVLINKNDTVFGLIDLKDDISNSLKCRFKKTEKDSVRIYSPTQIYGYRFINGKYYVSREIIKTEKLKTVFVEYLVEGVVDLYFYRDSGNENHYLIGKQNLPIKEISVPNEIIYKDGKMYQKNFFINRNILKFYLQDCPEIYSDIDQLEDTHHKELIQLIKKYHDIHCPNDLCLIYQKKMPKLRIDIQPIIGLTCLNSNLYNIDNNLNKFTFQYGVLSYFWLPLINDKMYIKTGLIINHMKGYRTNYTDNEIKYAEESSIKIPLQVHYQFFKTNITPVMSAGFNFYSTSTLSFGAFPTINLGLNAKITDKLYATLSSDFDYSSSLFIIPFKDTQIISYSLNLGLAVIL
jgi:hypothetical protein